MTTGEPLESKTFTYGNANWRDQLTAVNGVGITYDQIGNPLSDGTWQYEWINGRQLARIYNVDTDASFVYNENGLRVRKTVNGEVTNYTLHGKNIVHMTQGENELHFFYDAQSKPAIVLYNGVPYSYVKNLQGDVVAILDQSGNVVVQYTYDAWGRPISCSGTMASTLGKINPFRYRGYVYDEETGLYYLRSRYYVSHNSRFLNCDNMFGKNRLLAHNFFSYCRNKVVKVCDSNGYEEEEYTLSDLGVELFELTKGEYYRVRPAVEGVRARNIETNSPVKIYTMYDDTGNAVDYCARYTGSHFEFYYMDQIVSLSFDDVSNIDYGDEWAYYLGYNTETVVPDTHQPRVTTWHTQLALNYATGMFIKCDGTFCHDSMKATMAFQAELAKNGVEITVDGWAGKDTKPWLLAPLLEALYDIENNLPP